MAEQVAHPRCADADEHLDEVGAAEREIGDLRLACHRARQERLPGTGRSDQQDPARHARTQLTETPRRFEEFDDFFQLVLGLVNPNHLVERNLLAVTGSSVGQMLGHRPHRISQ